MLSRCNSPSPNSYRNLGSFFWYFLFINMISHISRLKVMRKPQNITSLAHGNTTHHTWTCFPKWPGKLVGQQKTPQKKVSIRSPKWASMNDMWMGSILIYPRKNCRDTITERAKKWIQTIFLMTSFHKNLEKNPSHVFTVQNLKTPTFFPWPCFFPSNFQYPTTPTDSHPPPWVTWGWHGSNEVVPGLKIPMNQEKLKQKHRICIKNQNHHLFCEVGSKPPNHWDFCFYPSSPNSHLLLQPCQRCCAARYRHRKTVLHEIWRFVV